jgi:hypothetical protein
MLHFIKLFYQKIQYFLVFIIVSVNSLPIWADLPKPPDADTPSGSNDWIDVGGNLAYKTISYGLIAIGAMILLGVAFGIFKAYSTAQEKQDLGHFFKHTAVAVAATAIGAGLLYAGYIIIPTND